MCLSGKLLPFALHIHTSCPFQRNSYHQGIPCAPYSLLCVVSFSSVSSPLPPAVIESGQGMIATGKNLFAAKDCPINTYGAAGKVYGWAAAPCKPCPRNMITDGLQKVNNSDVCINDDGFGYQSEGASRCAPGFYAVKGSRRPCRQCPTGRSTDNIPALQRLITDCWVKPGFGVVNSTANSTDAFNPNTDGMSNETLVQLPVLECPIGYYGPGKSVGAECIACAPGSSTEAPGATSADQCTGGHASLFFLRAGMLSFLSGFLACPCTVVWLSCTLVGGVIALMHSLSVSLH